jgi:hypothetical protein
MLITTKTVARTVEKDKIHLYRHRRYVKSPDNSAKKEYQRRVSPMVFNGGRPRLVQRNTTKADITNMARDVKDIAHPLR